MFVLRMVPNGLESFASFLIEYHQHRQGKHVFLVELMAYEQRTVNVGVPAKFT